MKKYVCETCGYVYDPEVGDPDGGIEPGTAFEDIPDDWVCPLCGLGKIPLFCISCLLDFIKQSGFLDNKITAFIYFQCEF